MKNNVSLSDSGWNLQSSYTQISDKLFSELKPDAVNIDYEVDPKKIINDIQIPVQGGLDPKTMLTDKENLKKEAKRYLDIFKEHP